MQIDDDDPVSVTIRDGKAAVDGDLFSISNLKQGYHTTVLSVTSDDPTLVVGLKQAVVFNSRNNK